jgi:uncharacterized membrane protein required for colicin V production
MGTGFTLLIPYDQLLLLIMALFMFVGAMRGWYREFASSVVLVVLAVFLVRPELAAPVVRYVAGFLRILLAFLRSGLSIDLGRLARLADDVTLPFDGNNPYMFFIIALVAFVLLSYATGGTVKKVSPLSRILGGLLGLFNGLLVVSLFKEYALKYFQKASPAVYAAGPPAAVSVAVSSLPLGGFMAGTMSSIVLVLLGLMVAVLLFSMASGRRIGER